jgi:serine/threonine-protein kinase
VWADYDDYVGADAAAHRDQAIAACTQAVERNAWMTDAWTNLGVNYFKRARHAADPDRDLREALRAFDTTRKVNPRYVVPFLYEGQIYELMAEHAQAHGGDPAPELERAQVSYRGGLEISPKLPHLHNAIGNILERQASHAWDAGGAPEPLLDQARAAFEQAIASAPEQGYGYANVGDSLEMRAVFRRARGEDPAPELRAAIDSTRQALDRIPDHATFWAQLGMAHALLAADAVEHQRDPEPALAQAQSALRNALQRNPKEPLAQRYVAETRALRALRGKDPAGLDAAAQAFQAAIDLSPDDLDVRLAFARFYERWAAQLHDPLTALTRGLALVNAVLAIRPALPDALIVRASLSMIQAQAALPGEAQRAHAASAAHDFTQALTRQPALEKRWAGRARLAHQLAEDRR